ncbi:MAG: hypothetical protein WCE79_15415 [Xanthobacteraceae bacterium]
MLRRKVALMNGKPDLSRAHPDRTHELRQTALEHLEAARACMDETGDRTGSYLIECAIVEINRQLRPQLDPWPENWPAKKPLR